MKVGDYVQVVPMSPLARGIGCLRRVLEVFVLGGVAFALHAAGLVFSGGSGLLELRSLAGVASGLVYFVSLYAGMVVLATLGHVGGTLVLGR